MSRPPNSAARIAGIQHHSLDVIVGELPLHGLDVGAGRLRRNHEMQRRGIAVEPREPRLGFEENRIERLGRVGTFEHAQLRIGKRAFDFGAPAARLAPGRARLRRIRIAAAILDLGKSLALGVAVVGQVGRRAVGGLGGFDRFLLTVLNRGRVELERLLGFAPGPVVIENQDGDGLAEIGRQFAVRDQDAVWHSGGRLLETGRRDLVSRKVRGEDDLA